MDDKDKENIRIIDGVEYRLRSLAELDDVIEEILERNPWFVPQLEQIIKEQTEKKK